MDLFLLYLLGQADSLRGAILLISGIAVVGTLFFGAALQHEDKELSNTLFRISKISSVMFFVGLLIPRQDTLVLMVAGKAVLVAAQTDEAKSLASNSVKWLDAYVAKQAAALTEEAKK